MTEDTPLNELPQADTRSHIRDILRLTISAFVPVPGASDILERVIKSPLEQRREQWLIRLANAVIELQTQNRKLTSEYLANNPVFITAVNEVSQIAMRNHQEEYLQYLRNMVLNSALPESPGEDIQKQFFRMINTFTPWHVKTLEIFSHPDWRQQTDLVIQDLPIIRLTHQFPELQGEIEFANLIWEDLYASKLMNIGIIVANNDPLSAKKMRETEMSIVGETKLLTSLGKRFLGFVRDPLK